MQRVIDRNIETGQTSLADLEGIAAEFRDTIAGGREIVSILDRALKNSAVAPEGADLSALHFKHLDQMLANASLAPTTLPRHAMNEHAKEIAHYVGRHTGQEGIDVPEALADFADDFGGEVVEFVKKNKVLTTALGLGFYFTMTAAAQGPDGGGMPDVANAPNGLVSARGAGLDSSASIADLMNNIQTTHTPMGMDDMEREFGSQAIKVCHFHLPVKVPYFEHCLFSDQTVKQLQDGYELLKGPLSTVLDAPSEGVDLLAPRAADAPPIYFIDNFKSSLRATGDVWFVANGYQNLAHAPWAAVAGTMGYKLGAVPAIRKTSGLITPLIDGAYGLSADNKYLISNIPAIGYGYSEQGLSGAVMGATMASIGSYGLKSLQDHGQKALELLPRGAKNALPDRMRHGVKTSSNVIQIASHSAGDLTSPYGQGDGESGYTRTAAGLFVPSAPKAALGGGGLIAANDSIKAFEPLPDALHSQLNLKIAGRSETIDLDSETYAALVKDLTEFQFLLEHVPEQLGLVEEEREYGSEKERLEAERKAEELDIIKSRLGLDKKPKSKVTDFDYDEYLKRNVALSLDALKSYRDGEISAEGLESALNQRNDTILGAKIVHLASSGRELEPQQERALSIKGHQTARLFAREAARKDDRDELARTFFNAGRSLDQFKDHPVATPLALGLKGASAGATLGKMGIRNAWSSLRDDAVPSAQLGWNSIPAKMKGNMIGAGMLATAFAIKMDADPQFAQAVQDTMPFAGEAVANGVQNYSGAVGHAAGASTATGLFMVYNFGEDHLIIHISMGYACIIGGAGARLAVQPLSKVGKIAEVLAEEIADLSKEYTGYSLDGRAPGRAAKNGLAHLKRMARDVRNYDQVYLPTLNAA